MARVRYIGPEPATVPELGSRVVQPDEVVEVPDGRFEGYVCQVQTWESVEEPRHVEDEPTAAGVPVLPVAPLKKTAARPQKEG